MLQKEYPVFTRCLGLRNYFKTILYLGFIWATASFKSTLTKLIMRKQKSFQKFWPWYLTFTGQGTNKRAVVEIIALFYIETEENQYWTKIFVIFKYSQDLFLWTSLFNLDSFCTFGTQPLNYCLILSQNSFKWAKIPWNEIYSTYIFTQICIINWGWHLGKLTTTRKHSKSTNLRQFNWQKINKYQRIGQTLIMPS